MSSDASKHPNAAREPLQQIAHQQTRAHESGITAYGFQTPTFVSISSNFAFLRISPTAA